jgi:hypothetical protein
MFTFTLIDCNYYDTLGRKTKYIFLIENSKLNKFEVLKSKQ